MRSNDGRTAMLATLGLVGLAVSTDFLDHGKLLGKVDDPGWFEQNVPLLDVPDQKVKDIYYFRWGNYREHLYYTGAQFGYLSTEFLLPTGYGGPYGGIVAAAGFHITEGRWLRDQKPGKDVVNYWISGPGQTSKEANYNLNPDTYDWAHEYSFWAASSVWQQYLVHGDKDFVTGHLDNLVKQYRGYDNHFDSNLGLYWQAPVWDATELTAASYETDPADPYHGGYGFRPTINAYQYGDAKAISAIASLKGNSALANEYADRASALQDAMTQHLWDGNAQFFKHRARDNNPNGNLVSTREIMGYLPWMFNVGLDNSYSASFKQLNDPQGFSSPFGPTTAENRSTWFMHDAALGCCRWDGPSWPFATAQTLTAAENLLNNYPAQDNFSAADYFTLISKYVATHFKNGVPYIAEAHNAYENNWQYDTTGHSEDYNHSTFVDNIIAGLIGLRAQSDSSVVVNPLVDPSWTYFGLENVAYHGHNLTIIWDKSGTQYNQGQGLTVWVDGVKGDNRQDLGKLTVQVGNTVKQPLNLQVDIAANPLKFDQGTQPSASYTSGSGGDTVWGGIDGTILRVALPENSRWTSFGSPNAEDSYKLDFQRSVAFSEVRLYFYDDNDGVRVPTKYVLEYLGGDGNWQTVPNQQQTGTPANNALVRVQFPAISTAQIRITAPNRGGGTGWGLSEVQVWTDAVFQIRNVNSAKLMGVVDNADRNVQQESDDGSNDHLWRFVPIVGSGGWSQIVNVASKKLLAVVGSSTADSVNLQEAAEDGSANQLWMVEDKGKGQFVIRNKNSGLIAGVDRELTNDGASVVQFHDTGTPDHLWELLAAAPLN